MRVSPRYDGPPIIEIDGEPDDQLVPLTRQRRRLAATLSELRDDHWQSPSRCDGWSVQDVVAHLVGVNSFWCASVRAGLAGAPTRVLAGFDPAATPALMVAGMRDLTPREVQERFVASNEELLDLVAGMDRDDWARPAESPPGHVPIRLVACHALWDSWVHERDIALPLGLTAAVEPDEVVSCVRYAAALSPGLAIGNGLALDGCFAVDATGPDVSCVLDVGDVVSVRDDVAPAGVPLLRGEAVTLVEALSLRAPLPATAPPAWVGLLGGLATAFTNA